jgi:antitoxin component YwqK of YwqJK toxin-antitoxin module
LHLKKQTYNADGKLEIDMNYSEGKKHGTWKFYYPNGMEAHIENWNMNVKNGEFKTLNEKGEIVSQEFFKKGIPEGTHTFNFPNGKPKHITVYEKGEIVEETEFEELTGAKHVIIERVDKKAEKEKEKAAKNATATDDDPDLIKSEPTKPSKKKKKKKS